MRHARWWMAMGLLMGLSACARPVLNAPGTTSSRVGPSYRTQQLSPTPVRTFSPDMVDRAGNSATPLPGTVQTPPPWLRGRIGARLIRYETDVENEVERLADQARALQANLSALYYHRALRDVARAHSLDMAAAGALSQASSTGKTLEERVTAAGFAFKAVAMNVRRIAPDLYAAQDTIRDRLDGWLNKPDERARLLNPDFDYTGVGVYKGADGNLYITQVYVQRTLPGP